MILPKLMIINDSDFQSLITYNDRTITYLAYIEIFFRRYEFKTKKKVMIFICEKIFALLLLANY